MRALISRLRSWRPALALGSSPTHVQIHALHSSEHAAAHGGRGVGLPRRRPRRLGPAAGNRHGTAAGARPGFALLARQLPLQRRRVRCSRCSSCFGDLGYALRRPLGPRLSLRPRDRPLRARARDRRLHRRCSSCRRSRRSSSHGTRSRLIGFDPLPRDSLISVTGNAARRRGAPEDPDRRLLRDPRVALHRARSARRLWQATPRMRRILAPLALAASRSPCARSTSASSRSSTRPSPTTTSSGGRSAAFIALPIALRRRAPARPPRARRASATSSLELEHAPTAGAPRRARAVARRSDARGRLLAARARRPMPTRPAGRSSCPRRSRAARSRGSTTRPAARGDRPRPVAARGARARPRQPAQPPAALENAQLQAEMRAQLVQVQESRVRIVTAADEERRRIERDLHDGAQQRLAALALQLRTAQRRLARRPIRGRRAPRVGGRRAAGRQRGAARARPRRLPGDPRPRRGWARRSNPSRCAIRFPVELDVRRGALPGAGRGDCLLRRLRGARERRQARAGVQRLGRDRAPQRACSRSRSPTTASAEQSRSRARGLSGLRRPRRGARRPATCSRARPATVRASSAEIPCES